MARFFNMLFSTAIVAAMSVAALPAGSDQNPEGIYFSYPTSTAKWHDGAKVYFSWRNAPVGNVQLSVVPAPNGPNVPPVIVAKKLVARIKNENGQCDGGPENPPCGRCTWEVYTGDPKKPFPTGSYRAELVVEGSNEKIYSDVFTIEADS
ncbi:uncharacterized protein UTRI_10124 [Ustilago trichophora]|uniref:Uncharacterized protein n=1 Tax=Ustilago trichophora TaxID=86804 RepID=A0A5C3E2D4_9BASI|nr:uncharacterized protein UTRI_10124 [Ustilago trichophora]